MQQYRYRYENNYTYQKHNKSLFRIPYPLWWLPIFLLVLILEWIWLLGIFGPRHLYNLIPAAGLLWGLKMLFAALKPRGLRFSDIVVNFPGYLLLILARFLGWARYAYDKIMRGRASLFKDA